MVFVTEIGISLTSSSTEFIIVSLGLETDCPTYVSLHPFRKAFAVEPYRLEKGVKKKKKGRKRELQAAPCLTGLLF